MLCMASRYPTSKVFDYCLSPIHVVEDGKDVVVPCGKCNGCLLHKANEWSMRVGMEIEATPFSIFFTLTYSNEFLPTLIPYSDSSSNLFTGDYEWISNHPQNKRFTLDKDFKPKVVLRKDDISFWYPCDAIGISNDVRGFTINYASKRDIQLWLKLLRSLIDNHPLTYNLSDEKRRFRYYIISEIGPTTFRAHFHGVLFPSCEELAEFLLKYAMFACWQMCDKVRFQEYAHYCDSGARGYVSQYITSVSDIPTIYKDNKEIRPFRLSSKAPAIGYIKQDIENISQSLSGRVNTYYRPIERLGVQTVLRFPSRFTDSRFPKAYRYSRLSFCRLYCIYALRLCWRGNTGFFALYLKRLRGLSLVEPLCETLEDFPSTWQSKSQNITCGRQAFKFCKGNLSLLEYYLYCLDMNYYLSAMDSLRYFYQYQDELLKKGDKFGVLSLYSNFGYYVALYKTAPSYERTILNNFLAGFGFVYDFLSLDVYRSFCKSDVDSSYALELEDIISTMTKSAKYNELIGNAPTIV